MSSLTFSLIVIGVRRSPLRAAMSERISRYGMWRSVASRWTTKVCVSGVAWSNAAGQSCTAVPGLLETRTSPFRSRMEPRGAGARNVRTWLFFATSR